MADTSKDHPSGGAIESGVAEDGLTLGRDIYAKYGVSPGVIASPNMFAIARRTVSFGMERLPLLSSIQRRFGGNSMLPSGWSALHFVWNPNPSVVVPRVRSNLALGRAPTTIARAIAPEIAAYSGKSAAGSARVDSSLVPASQVVSGGVSLSPQVSESAASIERESAEEPVMPRSSDVGRGALGSDASGTESARGLANHLSRVETTVLRQHSTEDVASPFRAEMHSSAVEISSGAGDTSSSSQTTPVHDMPSAIGERHPPAKATVGRMFELGSTYRHADATHAQPLHHDGSTNIEMHRDSSAMRAAPPPNSGNGDASPAARSAPTTGSTSLPERSLSQGTLHAHSTPSQTVASAPSIPAPTMQRPIFARSVRGRISQFVQRELRTPESMPSTPQRIVVGPASLDVTHPTNSSSTSHESATPIADRAIVSDRLVARSEATDLITTALATDATPLAPQLHASRNESAISNGIAQTGAHNATPAPIVAPLREAKPASEFKGVFLQNDVRGQSGTHGDNALLAQRRDDLIQPSFEVAASSAVLQSAGPSMPVYAIGSSHEESSARFVPQNGGTRVSKLDSNRPNAAVVVHEIPEPASSGSAYLARMLAHAQVGDHGGASPSMHPPAHAGSFNCARVSEPVGVTMPGISSSILGQPQAASDFHPMHRVSTLLASRSGLQHISGSVRQNTSAPLTHLAHRVVTGHSWANTSSSTHITPVSGSLSPASSLARFSSPQMGSDPGGPALQPSAAASELPSLSAIPSTVPKGPDLNLLANRVYELLVRRLASERQRRGF